MKGQENDFVLRPTRITIFNKRKCLSNVGVLIDFVCFPNCKYIPLFFSLQVWVLVVFIIHRRVGTLPHKFSTGLLFSQVSYLYYQYFTRATYLFINPYIWSSKLKGEILRDWSLITGRVGLENGKIAGPKLFATLPLPPQDRVKTFHAPPLFLKSGNFLRPPLQYG